MGKTFVMGARLQLKDDATGTFKTVKKATDQFKTSIEKASQATQGMTTHSARMANGMEHMARSTTVAGESAKKMSNHMDHSRHSFGAMYKDMLAMSGVMAAVTATLAAPVVGFKWMVGANADMETYRNTLTVVLGDSKKAVDMLAWANKFAAQTPFEIPEIVEATTRMSAYGLNAQKTLGIVGDMASVMGKDLMQAVEAVADAQTGELERLREFGITKDMIQAQAKLLGANPIDNTGHITDQKAFNAALFSLMEKRYKGGMEIQSKTFKGMLSNVKDFVGNAGRTLGAPIFDTFKNGVGKLLEYLNRVQNDGTLNVWAGKVKTAIDNAKTGFKEFMDTTQPIIDWLKDTGLPLLWDALTKVGGAVKDVYTYVKDNWGEIAPVIVTIVGALTAWKLATEAVIIWTTLMGFIGPLIEGISLAIWGVKNATSLWEAAQWLLNVAMDANPIGATIVIISALGLAVYEVVKHFKDICAWVEKAWNWLTKWNKTDVNKKVPGVDTLTTDNVITRGIGKNAAGTNNWRGGLTWVGESGPELIDLPQGSKVYPNDVSLDMVGGARSKQATSSKSISIGQLVGKIELHDVGTRDTDSLIDEIINKLHDRLSSADELLSNGEMGALL